MVLTRLKAEGSKNAVFSPFLRSIRFMNQEIVVTHISKLEFFVQVIEKRQGKIIPIFIIFCRHESTNNETYSYDKHNKETR